jgi:hypothetical protein
MKPPAMGFYPLALIIPGGWRNFSFRRFPAPTVQQPLLNHME